MRYYSCILVLFLCFGNGLFPYNEFSRYDHCVNQEDFEKDDSECFVPETYQSFCLSYIKKIPPEFVVIAGFVALFIIIIVMQKNNTSLEIATKPFESPEVTSFLPNDLPCKYFIIDKLTSDQFEQMKKALTRSVQDQFWWDFHVFSDDLYALYYCLPFPKDGVNGEIEHIFRTQEASDYKNMIKEILKL